MANYLINYSPGKPRLFFVAGIRLGSINVEWEERSPTDESLGALFLVEVVYNQNKVLLAVLYSILELDELLRVHWTSVLNYRSL